MQKNRKLGSVLTQQMSNGIFILEILGKEGKTELHFLPEELDCTNSIKLLDYMTMLQNFTLIAMVYNKSVKFVIHAL